MNHGHTRHLESRSMLVSMWGNLFMAAAGIIAGVLSNSTAIMVDGLFSMVGFTAALLGRRIIRRVDAGPDLIRPLGYAADEALFATFRSLTLLGLVLFAIAAASRSLYEFAIGVEPEPLNSGPMVVYFALIGLTCLLLWAVHTYAWRRTGRVSDILRLEARASAFDAMITAAAGIGLGAIYVYPVSWLQPIAPVGDSLIVLLLCLVVIGQYVKDFRSGLNELAGVSADDEQLAVARQALQPAVREDGGDLKDVALTKLGRTCLVTVCYDPGRAVSAATVDQLNLRMIREVRRELKGADVLLMISEFGRRWPDHLSP